MSEQHTRELIPVELALIAGGYTLGAANQAAVDAMNSNGGTLWTFTYNDLINPQHPGSWDWQGDGNDNGSGGYAVWYNESTNTWASGPDTPNGTPPYS